MKILVISQYYYPEEFRINDICEELVKRGHSVTVVAGIPNYPKGEIFEGYENSYKTPEVINGVNVIRCHNKPRKHGKLNLLLNYISYYKKATKIVKKLGPDFDVVYGYQMSPIVQIKPAIEYKKKYGKPLYIYVCDIWPESIRDNGEKEPLSTKNLIYKYFKKVSSFIYRQADAVCSKCEEFIDYLVEVCDVERKKCSVNFEHAENTYLQVTSRPIDNGVVDFMFLGNIGGSSNCELIVRAAEFLKGDNYKIHFVGDGSNLDNVKKMASKFGLDNKIIFHGRHSQAEMVDFYNFADFCLLTLSNKTAIGLTPPAKLASYMASSRTIIASINGASRTIINASRCGFTCEANDLAGLVKLMQDAIDNSEDFYKYGQNGRQYFKEHFTIEKHVDTLERQLKDLIR